MSRPVRREEYTVGWVCALPVELAAVLQMLDEETGSHQCYRDDENLYYLGSIAGHNVVVVCLPAGHIGNNPAAAVAMQMRATFKGIRFGLMVGIGGGVPSAEMDIRLGDVVVSQPNKTFGGVVQYDSGKTTPSGFERTGSLNSPPQILLSALANVQANELRGKSKLCEHVAKLDRNPTFQRKKAGPDVLFEAAYDHEGGPTCDKCNTDRQEARQLRRSEEESVVHYGTIASGNQVMKNAAQRDEVSADLGGILCFEMEAAGLMNSFPCLVIRGICDYADSHKNKRWQSYAAAVAVAYGKELLSIIPAAKVGEQGTVHDAMDRSADSLHVKPPDLKAALANLAQEKDVELNWGTSIVDTLKLLGLDSGPGAREQLAERLHVRAGPIRSAKQNTALHKAVLTELAAGEEKWIEIMESRRNNRCFNCGSKVHWEFECPGNCGKCLYSGHKASNCEHLIRCKACRGIGHLAEDCPDFCSMQDSWQRF